MRTAEATRTDGGFVLLDALMATALAAFAGGAIIAIANSMLEQQGRELDRSVALVASQSLMQEYAVLGGAVARDRVDELYRYSIVTVGPVEGTTAVRAMAVVAQPAAGARGGAVRLDFIAAAELP